MKMNLVARTYAGLEEVLAEELTHLGAEHVKVVKRAVEYAGDKEILYKSNLWLRTALDILKPIHQFKAKSTEELYAGVSEIDWSDYLDLKKTFSVQAIVNSSYFNHSQFAALKCKDAIVDQFREKTNDRPDVDKYDPDLKIVIRISENKCSILLNSSGSPLFKRGYRKTTGDAPINEILAAGMVQLSEWNGKTPFIDPMCGSGTLCIEAGMKALNIAPGILRDDFAFQKWRDFDVELWDMLYFEAKDAITTSDVKIYGYDISEQTVRIAKNNMSSFRELRKNITFDQADFFSLEKPAENGIIITNPPYDKRIKLQDDVAFYSDMGTRLKHFWEGYDAWIISSNLSALKRIGLRPNRNIILYNGPDESKLVHLPLYRGKKGH
jgi:putative N6-adenine-specific DNA methylase